MNHKPLFLATALLVTGSVFWWMSQRQPVPVDQPVVTDSAVEAPAQVEPEKYPQHIEAIPGNTDEVWYNIPEMGIRMKLNKGFAEDLVYSNGMIDDDGTPRDGLYFSTQAIAEAAPECAPGRGGAFGVVSKIAGTVEEADKSGIGGVDGYFLSRLKTGMVVQLPGFFVIWAGPQAVCAFTEHIAAMKKESSKDYYGSGAKDVHEGMKTIELIPVEKQTN